MPKKVKDINSKTKNPLSQKEQDYITNKVLLVFTAAVCGILVLVLLYRLLVTGSTVMQGYYTVMILGAAGVFGVIFGFVRLFKEKRLQNTELYKFKVFSGKNIIIVSAIVAVCCLLICIYYVSVIKVLYVVLPVLAVYYLVYNVYQREFFLVTIDLGAAVAMLWIIGKAQANTDKAYFVYIALGLYAVWTILNLIACSRARNRQGVLKLGKNEVELFLTKNGFRMLILTVVIMLAILLAAVLLGPTATYYLKFVVFAYLFVSAVYYTVKLM